MGLGSTRSGGVHVKWKSVRIRRELWGAPGWVNKHNRTWAYSSTTVSLSSSVSVSSRVRRIMMGKQKHRRQYSLWIRPQEKSEVGENLLGMINILATRHNTEAFDPHVTLLSVFEIEDDDLEVSDTMSEGTRFSQDEVSPRPPPFPLPFLPSLAHN